MLKSKKTNYIIFVLLIIFSVHISNSQSIKDPAMRTINGRIIDSKTGNVIIGARLKLDDGKRGTYTNTKGQFKLPIYKADKNLRINSLGYKSKLIEIVNLKDSAEIELIPEPITNSTTNVTANIEVEEIIKRAINKKIENQNKLKTFEGTLYSKLTIELDGSIFNSTNTTTKANGNTLSITSTFGGNDEDEAKQQRQIDKMQMFILETFAINYKDKEQKLDKNFILQRRQTANFQPQDNILTLSKYVNFYDDNVKVINVDIVSPLSKNALSYYNYKLIDRKLFENQYIYIIEVSPKSDLYPGFIGKINILETTYNLVEINLEPSATTAIDFFKFISFSQKFENNENDIWSPTLLETKARAKVEILSGVIDIGADVTATSMYNNIKINKSLPDSVYLNSVPTVTVARLADSAKIEFWEQNSLRTISEKELLIYNKIDSLAKLDTNEANKEEKNVTFSVLPILDYNRVAEAELGLNLTSKFFKTFETEFKGSYSTGQKRFFGDAGINLPIYNNKNFKLDVSAKYTNQLENAIFGRQYEPIVNNLFANLMQNDFYDYYINEGIDVKLNSKYEFINLSLNYQNVRNYSAFKTTDWSIFKSYNGKWRELDYMDINDLVDDGHYNKYIAQLDFWNDSYKNKGNDFKFKLSLNGMAGEQIFNNETNTNNNKFNAVQAKANLYLPLFYTGYQPIALELHTSVSRASKDSPNQYLFRLPTHLGFITTDFAFMTAPLGYYGGYEMQTYGAKLNLSDYLWRGVGLPTYEGRGPELSFTVLTGKTLNNRDKSYITTNGQYFTEVGFGFDRIPTFISNVFYLGFELRFGLGPIKTTNTGFAININFPF